jgi:hypothetical protein
MYCSNDSILGRVKMENIIRCRSSGLFWLPIRSYHTAVIRHCRLVSDVVILQYISVWQIGDDYVYIAQDVEENSGVAKICTLESAIK